jgi:hypothetical protein
MRFATETTRGDANSSAGQQSLKSVDVPITLSYFPRRAVSTTIFAGCLALTAGSAFVLCVAAAAAAHVLNIAAAKQRYQACVTRAQYECQNV